MLVLHFLWNGNGYRMKKYIVSGTIVAKKEALRGLFLSIYRWSLQTNNPQQLRTFGKGL